MDHPGRDAAPAPPHSGALPLDHPSVIKHITAAEAAAGRDASRQARAARIMRLLADLPAAVKAAGAPATAADLRRAIARLTHKAVADDDDEPPGPHADDWRALAAPFTASGVAAGFVRPRLLRDYRAAFAPAPDGHLARASPPGLYALHLLNCSRCRRAEAAGTPCATCPIHTVAALAEGVWPVWAPGADPPGRTPARLPYREPAGDMPPGDDVVAAQSLADLVATGCGQWLTDQQVADPAQCSAVAPVWVVTSTRRPTPPGLDPGDGATIDVAALAAAAAQGGRTEADAYVAAAAGATPDTPQGRRALAAAWAASTGNAAPYKRRVVERLDLTVNLLINPMGVSFPRVTDVLAGALPSDSLMADDAVMGYRALPTRPSLAAAACVQCPLTLRVYRPGRLPFGYSQSCAAYCAFTGVIKESLGSAEALAEGWAGATAIDFPELEGVIPLYTPAVLAAMRDRRLVVTGVVDDILGRHPASVGLDVYALRAAVFAVAGYTRSPTKHRAGAAIVMLGLWCAVRGPSGRPTASLTTAKLFQTLLDTAKWARIAERNPAHGCVPLRSHEALIGDLGWAAQADPGVGLRLPGPRAALFVAKKRHHLWVRVGGASPCAAPLADIVARALGGRARCTTIAPLDELLGSLALTATLHPVGMQVTARLSGQRSRAYAMDASVAEGVVKWARLTTSADGSTALHTGSRAAAPGESSTSAELEALAQASESFGDIAGGTVVCIFDSLAAQQCLARHKATYGSAHYSALIKILTAADLHGVALIPIWVVRTANTLADAGT